jgi:hypothetical protein
VSKKPKSIVKNGRRVPASTKGKAAKRPPSPIGRPFGEPAAKPAKEKKAKRPKAVERAKREAVKPGVSDTTRGQLIGLVDEFDKLSAEMESLKGEKSKHTGDLVALDEQIRECPKDEDLKDAECRAKLIRLERAERDAKVKLAGVLEKLSGAKEARKSAFQQILDLIRDMDPKRERTGLIFENGQKPPDAPATIAAPPGGDSVPGDEDEGPTIGGHYRVYSMGREEDIKVLVRDFDRAKGLVGVTMTESGSNSALAWNDGANWSEDMDANKAALDGPKLERVDVETGEVVTAGA